MFKACLIHFEARWSTCVTQGLVDSGMRCRRARLWRDEPAQVTRTSMAEEVVWDPNDPQSVQSVIQGCNFIFFDGVHALSTHPLKDVIAHLRALCDGLRQGGGDRVILMSSCVMAPKVPGEFLADERRRAAPHGVLTLRDKLAILHLEMDRYAVDAMHINVLMPGVVFGPEQPVAMGDAQAFNVMAQEECVRMMHAVCTEGRAGIRYVLGGTNTTRSEWERARPSLGTPGVNASNLLACSEDHALDTSLAQRHLGLEPVASVLNLVQ